MLPILFVIYLFQSSPAPRSGCNFTFLSLDTVIKVSILTRSEERVQRTGDVAPHSAHSFQSSPAPRSGCNFEWRTIPRNHRRFNPHPLRGAGATAPGQ